MTLRNWVTVLVCVVVYAGPAADAALADEGEKGEVVVTATRWSADAEATADRVTVVTKEEIEALPAVDVAGILESVAGVVVDRPGASFGITSASVYGSEHYQTTVLINGVPFNDLGNGFASIGEIPADQVDRIEVLHGSTGSEWGSAMGGVINIIIHKPTGATGGYVKGVGGEYATVGASAGLEYGGPRLSVAGGGGYRTSDGPETDKTRSHKNESGLVAADVAVSPTTNLFFQGYSFQGKATTGVYAERLAGLWQENRYRVDGVSGQMTADVGVGSLRLTLYRQEQILSQDTSLRETKVAFAHLTDKTAGGSLIYHVDQGNGGVTLGGDVRSAEMISDQFPKDRYSQSTSGFFVTGDYGAGPLSLSGTVRHSNEDEFGTFTGYAVGLLYRSPSLPLAGRATVSTGYTIPTFGYRFAETPDLIVANPDLTVETVTTYQAGVDWKPGAARLSLTAFHAIVKDAISSVLLDSGLYTYDNFSEFTRTGFEIETGYRGERIFADAKAFLVETRDTLLDEVVRNKVRAIYYVALGYHEGGWRLMIDGAWRDWNSSPDRNAVDQVWRYNAKGSYTHPFANGHQLTLAVSAFNLTDVAETFLSAAPATPPRTAEATVEYRF